MRPIFFSVPVWGERYCFYLLDDLLPSLMRSFNLPILRASDGHRLVLATTQDDWQWLSPRLDSVRKYVRPEPIFIIPSGSNASFDEHVEVIATQERAQRALISYAHAHGAILSLPSPDCVFGNGIVAEILNQLDKGKKLILLPALRHSEESYRAAPLPFSKAAVQCLHRELSPYNQLHAAQPLFQPFRFWHCPGGVYFHTFYAFIAAADMTAVPPNHLDYLYPLECSYWAQNFRPEDSHLIRHIPVISLTPDSTNWSPTPPKTTYHPCVSIGFSLQMECRPEVAKMKRWIFAQGVTWGKVPAPISRHASRLIRRGLRPNLPWLLYRLRAWFGTGRHLLRKLAHA